MNANKFAGSRVLLTGCDGSLGSTLRAKLVALGATVHGIYRGTDSKAAIEQRINEANYSFDYVILNDGINHLSWIGTTEEVDARIMDVNVMAPYWALNAVVARQSDFCPARVMFVASQTYRVPQRTTALYCASKAAMVAMMRVAARELAPGGWIVNAIAPGKIEDTLMSEMTDAQVHELRGWTKTEADGYAKKLIPAGRASNRDEICDAILWGLLAPGYVNGAVLEAMGGV